MKKVTFIIFLCFFLLIGRNHIYAYNSHTKSSPKPNEKITKSHPLKYTNNSHNCILIEGADIDLEEEYDNANDFKNLKGNKFISEKFIFSNKWYSLYYNQLIINYNLKFFKTESFLCDQSTPIYIFQRVLRI